MFGHTFSMSDVKYLVVATVVIFLFEWVTRQLKGGRLRDYGITLVCAVLNTAVMRPLAGVLIAAAAVMIFPQHAAVLDGTPFLAAFFAVFALLEFAFYWTHRWAHEGMTNKSLEPLWKIHRTHHSAKLLDVSVVMRQNIFWAFVLPSPWIIGFCTYLGLGEATALATLIIYFWNLFTHTHGRWDDFIRNIPGVSTVFYGLQHVITSPSMHHTHHGYGKNGKMYRNFAVTLSIFDTMFGTLHIPDGRPAKYGVPGEDAPWAEEVFYPLNKLPALVRHLRGKVIGRSS